MNNKSIKFYIRSVSALLLLIFLLVQYTKLNILNSPGAKMGKSLSNASWDNILSMVPKKDWENYIISDAKGYQINASYTGSKIRRQIYINNEQQMIRNEKKFGPLKKDSVIIVVQVHTRIRYLSHLIGSLSHARGISEALLIFSHDFYNSDINDLVQSVDFCKVLQIFYPYSLQIYPHKFPGQHFNDCPRNISKAEAVRRNCNNAIFPDLYGHYREAKITQNKHHWWWKANRVFNELKVTRDHNGLILFLEDDHYVAEDFLHVLKLMQQSTQSLCPHCNIMSLGNYLKKYRFSKVQCLPWKSSQHNIGIAFNRTTWSAIRDCVHNFCTYDDYNWDWSLQHVSEKCLDQKLIVMVIKGSRVFHLGKCGVYHTNLNCEDKFAISRLKRVLRYASKSGQLYPSVLKLGKTVKDNDKRARTHGQWSDPRDHQLCFNNAESLASSQDDVFVIQN